MIDAVNETTMAPDQFLKVSSGNFTTVINLAFLNCKNREQALFTFLNSTLSPFVLTLTIGQKSGRGVWKVLEKRFASVSRFGLMSLKNELNAIKRGTNFVDVYFQKINQIRDILATVLDDEDLFHVSLDGLPSKYDSFSSAIRTHSDVLSVEKLNTLPNAKKRAIKKRSCIVDATSMAMVAITNLKGFLEEEVGITIKEAMEVKVEEISVVVVIMPIPQMVISTLTSLSIINLNLVRQDL